MNVYRIYIDTEKVDRAWTIEAGSTSSAIGKVIRREKATQAKRVGITCDLIAKNTSYKDWKAKQAQS